MGNTFRWEHDVTLNISISKVILDLAIPIENTREFKERARCRGEESRSTRELVRKGEIGTEIQRERERRRGREKSERKKKREWLKEWSGEREI